MKRTLRCFFLLVALLTLFTRCIKEGDFDFNKIAIDDNFSYDLALPLVDANMSLGDMLKSVQMAQIDENGLLHLIYEDEFAYDFSELDLVLPDQSFGFTLPSKIPIPPGDLMPDSIVVKYTYTFPLAFTNDIRVDSVWLNAGILDMRIDTDIRNRLKIKLSNLNTIKPDGSILVIHKELGGVLSGGQSSFTSSDIAGCVIKPDNSDDQNLHNFSFDMDITVYKDTNVKVTYLGDVDFSGYISNLSADLAYGYFGKQSYGPEIGELELPILNRFKMDSLEIEQATMKVNVFNGIGLPIEMDANILAITDNPQKPPKNLIIHSLLPYPAHFAEAYKDTVFETDFQDLINDNEGYLPNKIEYIVQVVSNPNEDRSLLNMFRRESGFKFAIQADIPMRLKVENLEMSDTFNFEGLPQAEGVHFFVLKANIHNGFPLEAAVMLYLLDENNQILDSVSIPKIDGAPADPVSGHILRQTVTQVDINMTRSQIQHLVNTRHFLIKGTLSSSGNDLVSIYEDESIEGHLKVMIGARIKADIDVISKMGNINLVF